MTKKEHLKSEKDKSIDYIKINDYSLNEEHYKALKEVIIDKDITLGNLLTALVDENEMLKNELHTQETNIATLKRNEEKLTKAIKKIYREVAKIKKLGGY